VSGITIHVDAGLNRPKSNPSKTRLSPLTLAVCDDFAQRIKTTITRDVKKTFGAYDTGFAGLTTPEEIAAFKPKDGALQISCTDRSLFEAAEKTAQGY
jgi:hypothetical protein